MTKPKTHLSETLKALMGNRNMSAADIHRMKPSLLNSFLSRIIRGDQAFIDSDDLNRLADCFIKDAEGNPTPMDAAAIIAAHCMDERVGPGAELVRITVVGQPSTPLSPKGEKALNFIRGTVKTDARTESLILNLAHLLGMKTC